MKIAIIFIISFVLPFIYWRSLFFVYRNYFNKPYLRTKTGLQIHHGHYGIVLVLIAVLILLFTPINIEVIVLLGLGTGLIMDEFISSIMMPGNRPLELEVYEKSLKITGLMFVGLVMMVLILAALVYK